MNYKIIDIFPTAVMKVKLNREITKEEINFVNKNENYNLPNAGNVYSKNTFILDEPEMNDIKKFCDKALQEYFKKIINPLSNTNINITQSWLNYTKYNEYHHEHNHPNSFISGVFYFEADNDKDSISFRKTEYNQLQIFYKQANDYNTIQTDLKVQTGDLVLFPSSVSHFVEFTKNTKTRISLAFNSFISGEIGMAQSLNYLKI